MISPDEAWRRIEPHLRPTGTAFCSRREALGAVLARPAVATCDQPANDVSALDGYAYAGDLAPDSVLPVAGVVAAGDPPGSRLTAGSALQIWTGAPLPLGADRVVGVEETARANREDFVRVLRPAPPGNAVRRRAEIVAAGDLLLSAGARLGPAALSLLASQGVQELEIVRPPRVAVVTTGDEVVAPDLEPGPGQLRDSHTDYLIAAGRRLGVELTALGIAPDDPRLIERWVGRGLEQFDVTLVCGGVSMGERDHTEHALSALGVNVGFDAVAIQPGKPLVFGTRGDRLLFGLPGNPASVMVAFRLFVVPALERLRGAGGAFWHDARVFRLAARVAGGRGKDRFVPARRELAQDGVTARPLGVRGSHDLVTFAAADLLVRVRAGEDERAAGDSIEAIDWA